MDATKRSNDLGVHLTPRLVLTIEMESIMCASYRIIFNAIVLTAYAAAAAAANAGGQSVNDNLTAATYEARSVLVFNILSPRLGSNGWADSSVGVELYTEVRQGRAYPKYKLLVSGRVDVFSICCTNPNHGLTSLRRPLRGLLSEGPEVYARYMRKSR